MENLTANQIIILIGAAAIILPMARGALRQMVLLVTPTAIQCEFEEGSEALVGEAGSEGVCELLERLRQLAFTPLGIKVELQPLGSKFRELALASREAKSFASILVVKHLPRLYYYYYTPFEDGAIVLTANGLFRSTELPDYIISAIPGTTPRELLLFHKADIDKMIDAGHRPFSEFTQESRVDATGLFYRSIHSKRRMRLASFLGLLILTVIAGVVGCAAWLIGW